MDIHSINAQFSAAAQPEIADFPQIATAGFKSIICARPDGETPGQPTAADMECAAQKAGLQFHWLPVVPKAITDEQIAQFRTAFAALPKPVFGYCRTGNRAVTLWALSHASGQNADALIKTAADAGFDIAATRERLLALGAK
jgi:sulfide:quinone oxidoreductase